MVSAPRSLNTCPCVRVRGVIKSVITFFITVWSGGTPAEDSGLLTMVVQTTAQILGCSLAAASSALPSCIQAEKTLRMFSDLSDRAYLYHSLCSSGRAPRTIRTWICRISKQHLSRGGVECNGPGRHTLQAIYSTHWFYFSIDCFFFLFQNWLPFFLTSVCLFVLSFLTYWWIYCYNLLWVFHRENMVHLSLYSNVWILQNFMQSFFFQSVSVSWATHTETLEVHIYWYVQVWETIYYTIKSDEMIGH